MKKLLLHLLIFGCFSFNYVKACADFSMDNSYFNLFAQELITDYNYYPFRLAYDVIGFNEEGMDKINLKNQNIEDWVQAYQGTLSYEEWNNLLINSDLNSLEKAKYKNSLKKLNPTDRQAVLNYLILAKTIEPYAINNKWNDYNWDLNKTDKVNDETLDYDNIIQRLKNNYAAANTEFLKMRYAYQMIRLAHYYYKGEEAVQFFDTYAEPLKLRNAVYYYALEQKGGALAMMNQDVAANYCFLKSFLYCKDRRESSLLSLSINDETILNKTLQLCENNQEKAALYFCLGYDTYTNPVQNLEKIAQLDPNSELMQVLSARAINQLEREMLQDETENPSIYNVENEAYINELKQIFSNLIQQKSLEHHTYYQLCLAYINYLNRDYTASESILNQIQTTDKSLKNQKNILLMINELAKQEKITSDFEMQFFLKYEKFFEEDKKRHNTTFNNYYYSYNNNSYTTSAYLMDLLANRYYAQGDIAKAYLCHNSFNSLKDNQLLTLLNDLEKFYQKPQESVLELQLIDYFSPDRNQFMNILNDYKSMYYLKSGDLKAAESYLSKIIDKGYKKYNFFTTKYDVNIFKLNLKEKYLFQPDKLKFIGDCSKFKFIKNKATRQEILQNLVELEKIAQAGGENASEANFLLGNFYYNITDFGYYRNFSHYRATNENDYIFNNSTYRNYQMYGETKKSYKFFNHDTFFDTTLALKYYENALKTVQNPELKTQILFGAAKAEQEKFYYTATTDYLEGENYEMHEKRINEIQNTKYRTYFKQLKNQSNTETYQNILTTCKYFEYYAKNY